MPAFIPEKDFADGIDKPLTVGDLVEVPFLITMRANQRGELGDIDRRNRKVLMTKRAGNILNEPHNLLYEKKIKKPPKPKKRKRGTNIK